MTLKYADELQVGDVWTERNKSGKGPPLSYRVLAVRDGLAATTVCIIAENLTTGQRRASHFFRVNRVEVAPP